MTTFIGLFLIALTLSSQASARILVVSDIDDTIKVSHILTLEKILTAPNIDARFLGMSELYQAINASSDNVEFAYVSNAPILLMTLPHRAFLSFNQFPEGELYLRENIPVTRHKVETITKIVQNSKPDQIIMIGDNGEGDIDVYAEIQERFPNIPSATYIHQVYSIRSDLETGKALKPGQIGFVTSIDLSTHILKSGPLRAPLFQSFVQQIAPRILKETGFMLHPKTAFPSWIDCRDFHEDIETQDNHLIIAVNQMTQSICQALP